MAIGVDNFSGFVQKGFAHAAFATAAGMRDDEQVRLAARNMYECIPFPVNIAIKMSVGVDGLERFALTFRDKLLAANITNLAMISPDDLRALLQKSIISVPSLSRFITTKDHEDFVGHEDEQLAPAYAPPLVADHADTVMNGHALAPVVEVKSWYLFRDETRYGPWSDAEFMSFVEQGQLSINDMVWRDGFADWVDVRELPRLLANKQA